MKYECIQYLALPVLGPHLQPTESTDRPPPGSAVTPAPLAHWPPTPGRVDTGGMRLRTTAALAATSLLGAGAAAVAAGRYAAGVALQPSSATSDPAAAAHSSTARGPLPAGFDDPPLTVRAVEDDRVELSVPRGLLARGAAVRQARQAGLPGTWGLTGYGCHALVGPLLDEGHAPSASTSHPASQSAHPTPHTVVRRLERLVRGTLTPGTRLWLTPQAYAGNPHDALGIDHEEISVPGELGPLPGWFVPGRRDVWIIAVHGLGATTEQPMNVLPAYHRKGLPVLSLGYRGDPGAPPPPDGVRHLGDTEWRDVEAAVRYALGRGAVRVVLHGWSSGATMALRAAHELALPPGASADEGPRGRISGLVLDSPVLDWRATLRALATARHTPRPLLPLAVRAAQGRAARYGHDGHDHDGHGPGGHRHEDHDARERPGRDAHRPAPPHAVPDVPTLVMHGPDDHIAPWSASRSFAAENEELVSLCPFSGAPHAAMWNSDPESYQERLRRFLTPLM